MWIKAVTPLVDILKISPDTVKDKGEINTKHFDDKDKNIKKTFPLQETCPIFGSDGELLQTDLLHDEYTIGNRVAKKDLDVEDIPEKDTFKCGRCKTQFQALTAFIDHKRTQCDFIDMTDQKTDDASGGSILLPDIVISNNHKLCADGSSVHAIDGAQELVELGQEPVPSGMLFLIVGNCQFLMTNPLQLTELTNELTLTPNATDKSEFILAAGNAGNEMTTLDAIPDNLVVASPLVEEKGNNDVIFTSEVTNDASLLNIDAQISSTENLGINDVMLEFQYGNDNNPMRTDKTDRIKTKLPCSYCGKLFEKPFNLQQHERVHTGERPFQCVICGRAFSQKANVRKHMMRHKVWPQAKQTLKINVDQDAKNASDQDVLDRTSYSCQYCSLSFSSYSLHKKHLAVHSDFKVYRCIQKGCDATFSDLDDFLSHSESHSSAEFQCHVCLKMFTSLEELGAHQYDHDLPNRIRKDINIKLKCEICHAQFKSAESLKNHLAVDTHNYECPHCKNVFNCERFLRRHLATHSDPSQSKFECEFCKKTFRTQKYLLNHSFIHSKEKPFNCELCSKQFASKYRLKRHLAIHLSQYLECPFKAYLGCDKKFYRKDKLRNHVTTHSYLKFRSCHVCSKTFTSFTKLQQHVKRDHKMMKKRQMLKCAGCSQTFRKQKQLLQHHCTVGEKKFKSRTRNDSLAKRSDCEKSAREPENPELVSNIEIIMVPFISSGRGK